MVLLLLTESLKYNWGVRSIMPLNTMITQSSTKAVWFSSTPTLCCRCWYWYYAFRCFGCCYSCWIVNVAGDAVFADSASPAVVFCCCCWCLWCKDGEGRCFGSSLLLLCCCSFGYGVGGGGMVTVGRDMRDKKAMEYISVVMMERTRVMVLVVFSAVLMMIMVMGSWWSLWWCRPTTAAVVDWWWCFEDLSVGGVHIGAEEDGYKFSGAATTALGEKDEEGEEQGAPMDECAAHSMESFEK